MSKTETTTDLILTPDELHANGITLFNQKQLQLITRRTPAEHIKQRKAKGGGVWSYVKGSYVKKMLNLVFGFNWDFAVLSSQYDLKIGQAYVHGRLTVRLVTEQGVTTIVKEQFGRADIKYKNEWIDGKPVKSEIPLDLGNDLKACTTDALKKCASELGFFQDVYDPEDYVDFEVDDAEAKELQKYSKIIARINALLRTCKSVKDVDMLNENFINQYQGVITPEMDTLFKTKRDELKALE